MKMAGLPEPETAPAAESAPVSGALASGRVSLQGPRIVHRHACPRNSVSGR